MGGCWEDGSDVDGEGANRVETAPDVVALGVSDWADGELTEGCWVVCRLSDIFDKLI